MQTPVQPLSISSFSSTKHHLYDVGTGSAGTLPAATAISHRIATRFGPSVDVRHKGAFKTSTSSARLPGNRHQAVVRLWTGNDCRELSVSEARAFAAELIAAAAFAESQNS